jgi:hypothetical protein
MLRSRSRRLTPQKPRLRIARILEWADAHYLEHGRWPSSKDGEIAAAPENTWRAVGSALMKGSRGLPGGTTLARLLQEHRGVRNIRNQPRLTVREILKWADNYYARKWRWPTASSESITGTSHERWVNVNAALKYGLRGLPGGSSLAKLLAARRHHRNLACLPPLPEREIVEWARRHHRRYGRWPNQNSGPVDDVPGETWKNVHDALRRGGRGLKGGCSLPRFLEARCGYRNPANPPRLTEQQILIWADAYSKRNGVWPTHESGAISRAAGETWRKVDNALRRGQRGLGAGNSIARLLARHRGHRNRDSLPRLTPSMLVRWADLHHQRTGQWPRATSGPVLDEPGEKWGGIEVALRLGTRGLRGGSSVAQLLAKHRAVRNRSRPPRLTKREILRWAEAHRRRAGEYPSRGDGPIAGAPGETWGAVDDALYTGRRGLPGRSSLSKLLASHEKPRSRRRS